MATDDAKQQALNGEATTVGNYFVSNYPPFSFWGREGVDEVAALLQRPSDGRPLGLYVHIPFCRKRCDFCYFKVYTDKNSKEVRRYLQAVARELDDLRRASPTSRAAGRASSTSAAARRPISRPTRCVGCSASCGGTMPWDDVEEVTYECEPGTLSLPKVQALKELGVTRHQLGRRELRPADPRAEQPRAPGQGDRPHLRLRPRRRLRRQINIDLIAGMVGETDANWEFCIDRTIEMAPESVTVYQMEVPYNTTIYQPHEGGRRGRRAGRRLGDQAALDEARPSTACTEAGYAQSSAYTVCRGDRTRFVYRDALWHGADMLGIGVSSFSHLAGVHFQNEHSFLTVPRARRAGRAARRTRPAAQRTRSS